MKFGVCTFVRYREVCYPNTGGWKIIRALFPWRTVFLAYPPFSGILWTQAYFKTPNGKWVRVHHSTSGNLTWFRSRMIIIKGAFDDSTCFCRLFAKKQAVWNSLFFCEQAVFAQKAYRTQFNKPARLFWYMSAEVRIPSWSKYLLTITSYLMTDEFGKDCCWLGTQHASEKHQRIRQHSTFMGVVP